MRYTLSVILILALLVGGSVERLHLAQASSLPVWTPLNIAYPCSLHWGSGSRCSWNSLRVQCFVLAHLHLLCHFTFTQVGKISKLGLDYRSYVSVRRAECKRSCVREREHHFLYPVFIRTNPPWLNSVPINLTTGLDVYINQHSIAAVWRTSCLVRINKAVSLKDTFFFLFPRWWVIPFIFLQKSRFNSPQYTSKVGVGSVQNYYFPFL